MNSKYIIGLGSVVLLITLVLVALTFAERNASGFTHTSVEMLERIQTHPHLLSPQELMDLQKEQACELVDLRDAKEFAEYSLEKATNLPLQRVLAPESAAFFATDAPKVLFDHDGTQAHMAWMLLTQAGYEHLYVLEGGIDNWRAHVDVATLEKTTAFEDEKPRYDYAKLMEK